MVNSVKDVTLLPSVNFKDIKLLPSLPGVYFVCLDGPEVIYIGQSRNIQQRFASHSRIKQFRSLGASFVSWVLVENVDALLREEKSLIDRFDPSLNGISDGVNSIKISAETHSGLKVLAHLLGRSQSDVASDLILAKMQTPEVQELAQRFARAMNSYKGNSKRRKAMK